MVTVSSREVRMLLENEAGCIHQIRNENMEQDDVLGVSVLQLLSKISLWPGLMNSEAQNCRTEEFVQGMIYLSCDSFRKLNGSVRMLLFYDSCCP